MAVPKQPQFKDQGGAATMDPSALRRWITSKVMRRMSSEQYLSRRRVKAEKQRQKKQSPHSIEYFHQLDDGYSHLAAQTLKPLLARYNIELVCHLVSGPVGDNVAEPGLLGKLSLYDAKLIAPHYQLAFPPADDLPAAALVTLASTILAAQPPAKRLDCLCDVGTAMWSGDAAALQSLAASYGVASGSDTEQQLSLGDQRQRQLKHYSGAMFYYGGEWYWGVDRLYHLEQRLAELGADTQPGQPLLLPRPSMDAGTIKDNGSLTLEIYPSLRSPYTAISFDRTLQLAKDSGVNLLVRPVIPMVMRGVPATQEKGLYILFDTGREARAAGQPFGNVYDPIGEPVRRAYSLYPWACRQGRGNAFISAFLRLAFTKAVNTNTDKGLRQVVEEAGLSWQAAQPLIGDQEWVGLLETNRLAMYHAGLWGVPSFRLLDNNGKPVLALWGQDRLWLIAREIKRLLAAG